VKAAGLDVVDLQADRQGLARVVGDESVYAAAGPAADDAAEPPGGLFVETGRKIGDDQEAVWLGEFAGLLVVCVDRFELVAEVLLDDVLHVVRQVGEPLLDVRAFRPDARVNQGLLVVGQVHEPGEVAAEADGIDDREAHTAGRQRGQQPGHDRLKQGDGFFPALLARLEQQRTTARER